MTFMASMAIYVDDVQMWATHVIPSLYVYSLSWMQTLLRRRPLPRTISTNASPSQGPIAPPLPPSTRCCMGPAENNQ
jgi:hypothetical protein